jgi:hypothetical protein
MRQLQASDLQIVSFEELGREQFHDGSISPPNKSMNGKLIPFVPCIVINLAL